VRRPKSLKGGFRGEIPYRFQRPKYNRECESSIPPKPATHSGVRPGSARNARMGRKSPLFAHSLLSPDSQLANPGAPIAESLQPRPRKFPFCGDYRRRLGAITTAARGRHPIFRAKNRRSIGRANGGADVHDDALTTISCLNGVPRLAAKRSRRIL
jgi:hypothetical protein